MRPRFLLLLLLLPLPLLAQTADRARVESLLRTLAADSMEGRRTASDGERRAGRFLADEMAKVGLAPAGDDGYYQRVPLVQLAGNNGRPGRLVRAADTLAPVDAPASRHRFPSTLTPWSANAARAPASLCPPRET